jgi:hypothetical protein
VDFSTTKRSAFAPAGNGGAEWVAQTSAAAVRTTAASPTMTPGRDTSNGEVEGPDDHVGEAPRAHHLPRVPRRQTDHASRTPPTIVRGTATTAKQSRPGHLALPHRAPARSSDVERNAAINEAAKAQCPRPRSGATAASAAAIVTLIPQRFMRPVQLSHGSYGPDRRGNEGLFQTGIRNGRGR